MNILVFFSRLVLGFFFVLFFIIDFLRGNNHTAWACVAVAASLLASLVPVLYRRQKLAPLSALKNNFNRQRQLAWARAFFGCMFAFSGIGNIYANKQVAGIGLVFLGVFLLSPFGNWVFSYNNEPSSQETGMVYPWDRSMTRLAIIRTLGLIVFLLGMGAYIGNDISLGRVLVIVGLVLVFIRQIDVLFKHK
jgi:hypothetical protein